MNGQIYASAALPSVKEPAVGFQQKLRVSKGQSGHFGKKINLFNVPGIELRFLCRQPVASSIYRLPYPFSLLNFTHYILQFVPYKICGILNLRVVAYSHSSVQLVRLHHRPCVERKARNVDYPPFFYAGLTEERMTYVSVTEWRSRGRDLFHHMLCIRIWGMNERTPCRACCCCRVLRHSNYKMQAYGSKFAVRYDKSKHVFNPTLRTDAMEERRS